VEYLCCGKISGRRCDASRSASTINGIRIRLHGTHLAGFSLPLALLRLLHNLIVTALSPSAGDSSSVAFFALEGRPKFINLSNPPKDHALAPSAPYPSSFSVAQFNSRTGGGG
jgi:hypothetical protein